VVPSVTVPALVAPAGAVRLAESVTPFGMAVGMLAEIFALVWFVVMAQVEVASETFVGPLPAVAAVMVSDGDPVTAIWLIAVTANVTVWVAVD
jgi:hypothetical protein